MSPKLRFMTKEIAAHACKGSIVPMTWLPSSSIMMAHPDTVSQLEGTEPSTAAYCDECEELWIFLRKE